MQRINSNKRRFFTRLSVVTSIAAAYAAIGSAYATSDTVLTFVGSDPASPAELSDQNNYSPNTVPLTNTTDLLFGTAYPTSTTTFTLSNNVAAGSLDDIDAIPSTQVLIEGNPTSNSSSTVITLGGGGDTNGVTGAAASDLVYTATGSYLNFKLGGTSTTYGTTQIALAQTGNFDAAGTSTIYLNSKIIGGFGFTKTGTGTLALENSGSTFSGGVSLAAGTLQINAGGSLGTAPATANLTFTGNSTLQFYTATSAINGGTITSVGSTRIFNVSSGVTASIDSNGYAVTLLNPIQGPGIVQKIGTGSLYLADSATANNFSGGVLLSAGALQVNAGQCLGNVPATGPNLTFTGNSTLQFYNTTSAALGGTIGAFGATRIFSVSTGITGTLDTDGYAVTLPNQLTGLGSFQKSGTGTLTLTGTSDNYSGNTAITGGVLSLGVSAVLPSTALTLGGGTLQLATGYKSTQNFSGTTLTAGTTSAVSASTFSTSALSLALGTITPTNGGSIDFTLPTTGSITIKNTNTATNYTGTANPILGEFATANGGTTWAVSAGTGTVAGNVTALANSGYDTTLTVVGANEDVSSTSSGLAAPVATANSLRFNSSTSVTLALTSSLTVSTGGILETPAVSSALVNISGGSITSGNGTDLDVTQADTGASMTISSLITDNGSTSIGFSKTGAGTLILTAANTFTGPTAGGTNSPISSLIIPTVTLANSPIATLVLGNQLALQDSTLASGTVAFATGVTNFTLGGLGTTGTISLQDLGSTAVNLTVGGNNASTSFGGVFIGTGSVIKVGTGTLTLANANSTFTGGFNISGGVVQFNAGAAFGATANIVSIQNGAAIYYNGSGPASFGADRSFVLGGGTDTIQVGAPTSNLNNSSFTIGAVGNASSGVLSGTGTLLKAGQGTLTLAYNNSYTGGTTVTGGTLIADAVNSLGASTITSYTGSGPLTIIPASASASVNFQSSTAAVSSLTNYVSGVPAAGTASIVLGSAVIGGSTALSIGADNTSTTYSGTISDLSASFAGATGSLTKVGSGTLTLGGSSTYTGNTDVSAGTLAVATTGSLATSANVIVPTGGTLTLLASTSAVASAPLTRTLLNLNVSGGSVTLAPATNQANRLAVSVSSLSLTGGGQLDVGNSEIDVKGAGAAGLSTLNTAVTAGYAGGAWNGLGGITSVSAASDPKHLTAVGVILNGANFVASGSFDGLTPGPSDVLIKYTYYGDTNLDGAVDGSDYTNIDAGFSGHLTGWQNGDFNYDNVVDGSDYTLIDNAFNTQGSTLGTNPLALIASSTAQIAGTAVPEPTCLGLLGVGAASLLGRRRRKEFRGQ